MSVILFDLLLSKNIMLEFIEEWGHSSAGRALRWQRRGQGFDPPWLHHSLIFLIYRQDRNKFIYLRLSFFVTLKVLGSQIY